MAKKAARKPKANCQGGALRQRVIAKVKTCDQSWLGSLKKKSPQQAAEVESLIAEWVDNGPIRDIFPKRYALAKAIASEFSVSHWTISRLIEKAES
jgi:predicted nucleic acid-binding protein